MGNCHDWDWVGLEWHWNGTRTGYGNESTLAWRGTDTGNGNGNEMRMERRFTTPCYPSIAPRIPWHGTDGTASTAPVPTPMVNDLTI